MSCAQQRRALCDGMFVLVDMRSTHKCVMDTCLNDSWYFGFIKRGTRSSMEDRTCSVREIHSLAPQKRLTPLLLCRFVKRANETGVSGLLNLIRDWRQLPAESNQRLASAAGWISSADRIHRQRNVWQMPRNVALIKCILLANRHDKCTWNVPTTRRWQGYGMLKFVHD